MSILVVDDNTMLLSKIVRSLIRANRKVRSATSLTEAREVLNKETPEVLCLDLQLPDGSGMDRGCSGSRPQNRHGHDGQKFHQNSISHEISPYAQISRVRTGPASTVFAVC